MSSVDLFLRAARAAQHLLGQPEVFDRWSDPSALEGYTVAALVTVVRDAADRLERQLAATDLDRRLAVLDGTVLTLEEYLVTRLVELVVHLDDLAVSAGCTASVDLPEEAYVVVAGVLAEIAARRSGGLATVRSLARRERHPAAVRAL